MSAKKKTGLKILTEELNNRFRIIHVSAGLFELWDDYSYVRLHANL